MLEALPDAISSFGGDVDRVIRLIYWVVGVWFILAEGVLIYAVVRFRKRDGAKAAWLPADTLRTNAWVLIPAFLVLLFDLGIEVASASVWTKIKQELPPADILVRIRARQFLWEFDYAGPDGVLGSADDFTSAYELHVPKDKTIRFQLESADVIHSFWVPVLRLKQDAIPGRSIPGWFDATKTGRFSIACAELCGGGHGIMQGFLVVEEAETFSSWASAQAGKSKG